MSDALFDAIDATWAPAAIRQVGPWRLRDGQGGGKRVSAVSATRDVSLAEVEAAMTHPLFMIRPQDTYLDDILDRFGYSIIDPVDIFISKPQKYSISYQALDTPSTDQKEIWQRGGIGPARLEVMARTNGPKTYLSTPHATAFAAIAKNIAMVHAVEVDQAHRGKGHGKTIMQAAFDWANKQNAQTLALAVTTANKPAQNLYHALGMTIDTHYHYRIKS